jgi:acetoin utilization protein AcuB
MTHFTVQKFMTRAPYTVRFDQPLSVAHQLMREHDIRHLPVLQEGKLAGLLSQRDLYLIESFRDVDPAQVAVSEAMSTEVYAVGVRASVRKVAAEMAMHKYGSAVVMDREIIVGVFTTVDALAALSALLEIVDPTERRAPR